MREITVTVRVDCQVDEGFDDFEDAEMVRAMQSALARGWPLLSSSEISVTIAREPCSKCGWIKQ